MPSTRLHAGREAGAEQRKEFSAAPVSDEPAEEQVCQLCPVQHRKSCLVEGQVRADTEHFKLLFLEVSLPMAEGTCPQTGMDDGSAKTLSHSFSLEAV